MPLLPSRFPIQSSVNRTSTADVYIGAKTNVTAVIDWMALETALTSWIERADSCLALPHWRCMCEQFCALMSNRHLPSLRSLNPAEEYVTSVGFGNLRARRGGADRGPNPILYQEGSSSAGISIVLRTEDDFTSATNGRLPWQCGGVSP